MTTYASMCDPIDEGGVQHGLISGGSALLTCTDAGGGSRALDVVVKNFPAGGSQVEVTNFPATQAVSFSGSVPVTGTFWQTTQPVSGPLTDTQLRAAAVPVSGTFWQSTQPVSGPLTDAQLRATAVPVSGTFWQATQPISGSVSVSNFPSSQAVTGTFWQATQPVSGPLTDAQLRAAAVPVSGTFWQATQPVSGPLTDAQLRATAVPVSLSVEKASTLHVTATAAVNTACTLTLPAAGSGLFHYITMIQVTKLYNVVGVAAGAGVIVTTTNMPGNPAFTTEQLASPAGTATKVVDISYGGNPIKSSVANTATTIVCPQQLQTIWRVNVSYYTGA